MKRLIMMILALMLCASCAQAEIREVEATAGMKYLVETFEQDVPEELRASLDKTPFAGDRVLGGATLAYVRTKSGEVWEHAGLIAVEHEGKRLLLSAQERDGDWRILPESETFLRDAGAFTITVLPAKVSESPLIGSPRSTGLMLAVDYGADAFLLRPTFGVENYAGVVQAQWFEVYSYQRLDEKGDGVTITCGAEGKAWTLRTHKAGATTEGGEYPVRWPVRAEYIDGDDFPTNAEALKAWSETNPFDMDSWWVFAANLRMFPSTDSRSYGKNIIAPIRRLFSTGGWTMAQVGDTVGWISNTYVTHKDQDYALNHYMCQVAPAPVAKALKDTALLTLPDGQEAAVVKAGDVMQILAHGDGWYHVQMPQGDLSWRLDVPAVYGYIRAEDTAVYASPLCMKYDAQ